MGYSNMPGLAHVAELTTCVTCLETGVVKRQARYLCLSPAQASPQQLLTLNRGHWGIENRLFHVKDDSFGEDRHVLQRHCAGFTLCALRNTPLALLITETSS